MKESLFRNSNQNIRAWRSLLVDEAKKEDEESEGEDISDPELLPSEEEEESGEVKKTQKKKSQE